MVDSGYREGVDNTRATPQFCNYTPQWSAMGDACIRDTVGVYVLGFGGSEPLHWDNDQNSVELGSSQVSSIVVKFCLYHESLLSVSSMMIIAERVQRIQSHPWSSLLKKEQNLDTPTLKLTVDFAHLKFLEYRTVITSTRPHVSISKHRKPLRQDTK